MNKRMIFLAAIVGAMQSYAKIVEVSGLRADQSVSCVKDATSTLDIGEKLSFMQNPASLETWPVKGALNLRSYSWVLFQNVDVDGDGLLDIVEIHAEIKGSGVLYEKGGKAFATGTQEGIEKGGFVQISIPFVQYTLANGMTERGRFLGFNLLELDRVSGIKINGKQYLESSLSHKLNIAGHTLRVESLSRKEVGAAIAGVSFRVEVGAPIVAESTSVMTILGSMSPLLLLLLRCRSHSDDEGSLAAETKNEATPFLTSDLAIKFHTICPDLG